jgi:hypothetical protein
MKKQKRENQFLNLLINIIIPTIILVKFSSETALGPLGAVLTAIAFPLVYGIWDFVKTRDFNLFSIIGLVNILLTGGIAIFEIPPRWLAIKEAAVPLIIGALILIFEKRYPFVEKLLHEAIDFERMHKILLEKNTRKVFDKKVRRGTIGVAGSFLLSAILNFVLATAIVTSEPGTEAFAQELGKLTALSYPVIALPSMIILMVAMVYVLNSLAKLTGLSLEDILSSRTATAEKPVL